MTERSAKAFASGQLNDGQSQSNGGTIFVLPLLHKECHFLRWGRLWGGSRADQVGWERGVVSSACHADILTGQKKTCLGTQTSISWAFSIVSLDHCYSRSRSIPDFNETLPTRWLLE